MDKLVTLIVPVYNGEIFIDKCIKSILAQNYYNFEILIIDDGSVDNTKKILLELQKKDKRIKIIFQKNRGVSVARNMGIKYSKGEYIVFVDSDDTIEPTYLTSLVEPVENGMCDIAICGYTEIDIKKNILRENSTKKECYGSLHQKFGEICLNVNACYLAVPCLKAYKADIIKKERIFFNNSISYGEDRLFNLKYFNYINKVYVIPQELYNIYHYGMGSATEKFTDKRVNDELFVLKNEKKWLFENNILYKNEIIALMAIEVAISLLIGLCNDDKLTIVKKYRKYNKYMIQIQELLADTSTMEGLKRKILLKFMKNGINLPLFIYHYLRAT